MSEFETLRSYFSAVPSEVEGRPYGCEPLAAMLDWLVARRDEWFDDKLDPAVIPHAADHVFTPVALSQATVLLS